MNSNKKLLSVIGFVASSFYLSGCSSTEQAKETGFLSNYEQLQPSKKYRDTNVYIADSFNVKAMASVKSVNIRPFELWLPTSELSALGSKSVNAAIAYLHQSMQASFEKFYTIAPPDDKNALIVRGAISQVRISESELTPLDFIPFRVVMNAGNAAYLLATEQQDLVTKVGIEMEFVDPKTQQTLFAMTAVREIDTTVTNDVSSNTEAVKSVFDSWIEGLTDALQEVHQSK